jgi:hypothetical protein
MKIFNQFFNTPDYVKFDIFRDDANNLLHIKANLPVGAEISYHKFTITFVDSGE